MFQRMKAINHLTQPPREDVNLSRVFKWRCFSDGEQWPNAGSQNNPSDQWVTFTVPTRLIFNQEGHFVSHTK